MSESVTTVLNDAMVTTVSDEVEMMGRAKLRQVLEFLYVELCERNLRKMVTEACQGCVIDSPSQRDHDCMMTPEAELWACYYGDAQNLVDLELIQELCEDFTELLSIPMTLEWNHFIMNLANMSSSLARMIADDMVWANGPERVVVDFIINMCDTMNRNANEMCTELIDSFAASQHLCRNRTSTRLEKSPVCL